MYNVVVYYRDEDGTMQHCNTRCINESAVRRHVAEEILWESTVRVECAALNIVEFGTML